MPDRITLRTLLPAIIGLCAPGMFLGMRPSACFPLYSAGARQETSLNNALTIFSFYDHTIPYKGNLKLTLTMPEKHPSNPVVRSGLRVRVAWRQRDVLDFVYTQYRIRVKFAGSSAEGIKFYVAYIE